MTQHLYYTLAWADGTPVEVRPTGYGDLLAADRDAQMWAAATGRLVQVMGSDSRPTGLYSWGMAA
jgi:hypothetical protein